MKHVPCDIGMVGVIQFAFHVIPAIGGPPYDSNISTRARSSGKTYVMYARRLGIPGICCDVPNGHFIAPRLVNAHIFFITSRILISSKRLVQFCDSLLFLVLVLRKYSLHCYSPMDGCAI
jgi:hypothetical protein